MPVADPVISSSGREYSCGVSDLTPALSPWASVFAPSSPSVNEYTGFDAPFGIGVANPNFGFLSPHFDAKVQGQMLMNKIAGSVSPLIMGQSYDPDVHGEERYTVGGIDVDPEAGSGYLGEEAAWRLNNWRASYPCGGALRNIERGGFIDPFRPMTQNEYDAAVHYIGGQHRSPLVKGLTKAYTTFDRDKAKEKIRDDYADYISSQIGRGKSLNEVIQAGLSLPDYLDVPTVSYDEKGRGTTISTPEQQLQDYVDIQKEGSGSRVSQPIIDYPTNIHPTIIPQTDPISQNNADLLQSFFTPIGTGGGMGGIIEETPTGIVETALEPIYSGRILDPSTWLPGDHIDTTPVLDLFDTDSGI